MKRAIGLVILVGGCSAPFQYRVETRPAVWADTTWTAELGPPLQVRSVGEGKIVVTSYSIGESKHSFADRSGSDVNRRENGHVTAFDGASGQQLWDLPFDSSEDSLSSIPMAARSWSTMTTRTFLGS